MTIYELRLGLIELLFQLIYKISPKDSEGDRIRKALAAWLPPWRCHYACKGGWNVQLRNDCQHKRTPGKEIGFMTDRPFS